MRIRIPENYDRYLLELQDGNLVLPPPGTAISHEHPETETDITLIETNGTEYISTLFPSMTLHQWWHHNPSLWCKDDLVHKITMPGCPGHVRHYLIHNIDDWFRALLQSTQPLQPFNFIYFSKQRDEWCIYDPIQPIIEVSTLCEHCVNDTF